MKVKKLLRPIWVHDNKPRPVTGQLNLDGLFVQVTADKPNLIQFCRLRHNLPTLACAVCDRWTDISKKLLTNSVR